jgi:hypothetical protein
MKRILVCLCLLFVFPLLVGALFAANPPQAASAITVEDAKLGKDVKDRQIVDETAEFALNDKVYFWIKVIGAAGESLKATWKNGDHTYTSDLAIGGSPWRTWCYKTAALPGDWTLAVADSKGNILKEMSFKVK